MKKTKDVSDEDEYSADDPEEVEGAGSEEEWAPDGSEASESVVKKRPQRNAAKKRTHSEEDEEEEEEEDEEDEDEEEEEDEDESDSETEKKPKRKRRKNEEEEDDSYDEYNETGEPPKDYTSGAFVIAKADLEGDNDPTLWRIDGKALLQKYLPFKEDSKTLYKSTSTYSGWSINNKEKYLAAQVTFKVQNRTETIVELQTPLDGQQEAVKDDKEN